MSIKAAASQHHQLLMLPFVSNCSNPSVQTLLKSSSVFYDKPRGFRFDSLRCQYSASTDVSKDLSTQAEKGFLEPNAIERNVVRLGLPSKGRMATDTLDLLKDCQLAVRQVNPRQYVADIPGMGIADAILDLVGSGTTLRENNLKEIKGATLLESQGVFVASKRALLKRKDVLEAAHEMLERLEAHLRAVGQFMVTANMRGSSADEVAERVLKQTDFGGLQIGGSGVLVSPLTYIFDEEPPRWRKLLDQLNL